MKIDKEDRAARAIFGENTAVGMRWMLFYVATIAALAAALFWWIGR